MRAAWYTIATLAAAVLVAAGVQVAQADTGQSNPPECVKVNLVENSGSGPTLYGVQFCGMGGGVDSPVHDSEAGDTWIVDGGPFTSHAVVLDNG